MASKEDPTTMTAISTRGTQTLLWRARLGKRSDLIERLAQDKFPSAIESQLMSASRISRGATLVAIAKNEGRYILEWLAHHFAIGFDRIIVFNNDSEDNLSDILEKLAVREERLHFIKWPSKSGQSPQVSAYNFALQYVKTPWVICMDIDEFLVPFRDRTISNFLMAAPEEVGSIHINWRGFGSSGHQSKDYKFVTKSFNRCSHQLWGNNHHFKTIARTQLVIRSHVHNLEVSSGSRVLSDFNPFRMESNGLSDRIVHNGIQINHYQCKTFEEFRLRMQRGDANYTADQPEHRRDESYERFLQLDRNEEEDLSIREFDEDFLRSYILLVNLLK